MCCPTFIVISSQSLAPASAAAELPPLLPSERLPTSPTLPRDRIWPRPCRVVALDDDPRTGAHNLTCEPLFFDLWSVLFQQLNRSGTKHFLENFPQSARALISGFTFRKTSWPFYALFGGLEHVLLFQIYLLLPRYRHLTLDSAAFVYFFDSCSGPKLLEIHSHQPTLLARSIVTDVLWRSEIWEKKKKKKSWGNNQSYRVESCSNPHTSKALEAAYQTTLIFDLIIAPIHTYKDCVFFSR